jgi:hypothetical protein
MHKAGTGLIALRPRIRMLSQIPIDLRIRNGREFVVNLTLEQVFDR